VNKNNKVIATNALLIIIKILMLEEERALR